MAGVTQVMGVPMTLSEEALDRSRAYLGLSKGIGGKFGNASDVTDTVDYNKIADLFSSAVGDLQGSALKAEQEATKAYNELQYKMFKEANAFNSAEAQKAFEREMSSAEKQMAFQRAEREAAQKWQEGMRASEAVATVQGLRAAGLNPALALSGLGYASTGSPSFGSGASAGSSAASASSHSMGKANTSSALSVQERMLDSILSAAVSTLIARESNATKVTTSIIDGIFGLAGSAIPSTRTVLRGKAG